MEVTYIQRCGSDLMVVNAARVSFAKESWWNTLDNSLIEKDEKLIYYLAKHKHLSPFNHTFITMHIKAPIFVARQLVKHEYMPWNEVSRRYVDDKPEFYTPSEWRSRPEKSIKQGSGATLAVNEDGYVDALTSALRAYDDLLAQGVAPEQARMVLPQNMYTEWYWSGTLGAWAKMYNLRIDGHSQEETRYIAKEVGVNMEYLFPVSWKALTQ